MIGRVGDHPRGPLVVVAGGAPRASTPQFWFIDSAWLYQKTPIIAAGLISRVRRLAGLAIKRGNTSAFKIVDGEIH